MGRFSGQQTACLQGNIRSFKIATYLNVLFSIILSSAHVNKTLHFIQSRKRLIDGIEKHFGHETIALLNILHLHTHSMKYHRFRAHFYYCRKVGILVNHKEKWTVFKVENKLKIGNFFQSKAHFSARFPWPSCL